MATNLCTPPARRMTKDTSPRTNSPRVHCSTNKQARAASSWTRQARYMRPKRHAKQQRPTPSSAACRMRLNCLRKCRPRQRPKLAQPLRATRGVEPPRPILRANPRPAPRVFHWRCPDQLNPTMRAPILRQHTKSINGSPVLKANLSKATTLVHSRVVTQRSLRSEQRAG